MTIAATSSPFAILGSCCPSSPAKGNCLLECIWRVGRSSRLGSAVHHRGAYGCQAAFGPSSNSPLQAGSCAGSSSGAVSSRRNRLRGISTFSRSWKKTSKSMMSPPRRKPPSIPCGPGCYSSRMSFGRELPSGRKSSISGWTPIRPPGAFENAVLWNWSCRDSDRRPNAARAAVHR